MTSFGGLEQHLPIAAGLIIGAATHTGLLFLDSKTPTTRQTIGYLLLLGMVGLVATVVSNRIGATGGDTRALISAALASAARDVGLFIQRRGWKLVARAVGQDTQRNQVEPTIEELMRQLDAIPTKDERDD